MWQKYQQYPDVLLGSATVFLYRRNPKDWIWDYCGTVGHAKGQKNVVVLFTVCHSVAFLFLLSLHPEANRKGARKHQYSVWQTRLGFPPSVTHSYWFTRKQVKGVGTTEAQLSRRITLKELNCVRSTYRCNLKGKALPVSFKTKNWIPVFASCS